MKKQILCLCTILFSAGAWSTPTSTINWILNDFPPFIDVSGEMPGKGIADEMLRFIMPRMPEYTHHFEVASIARAHGLMAQKQLVCHPALLMNDERKKIMEFSDPVFFILTHRILIREDKLARFKPYMTADGSIDALRLVKDSSLVTAVTEKRGYSPSINAALSSVQGSPHILKAGVQFSAPFNQLTSGWIDYLFSYPAEYGWYREQNAEAKKVKMKTLRISGDPEFILGYVTCTKGEWGEQVIKKVNAAIKSAGTRPPWVDKTIFYTERSEVKKFEKTFNRHNPYRNAVN
ncbi:TIGR02285 family protein [Chitinibacter sp. FCG-7]|uniref:TIGR02285 family protein n=1 Tax=Chitinibacter mangrovi TaxID=3153927 RepID=A0AAU7F742_9NEIS